MSELYDYLITAYKVIAGLISTKRLIIAAIIAFGIYLVWVSLALTFSFQRKFAKNCNKLISFIKHNQNHMTPSIMKMIDEKVEEISSGFCNGWKKFKKSKNKKPSDCIQRRDSLDIEVTGVTNNQGKTFMKAFITFTTIVLFLFNFAYLGNNETITFYLIAETMVLPIVYYCVMLVFYILYTTIKQQLYKQDIECFYELVSLLDEACSTDEENEVETTFENITTKPAPVAFDVLENQTSVAEPVEETQVEPETNVEPVVENKTTTEQFDDSYLEKPIMSEIVEDVQEPQSNKVEEDSRNELFDLLAELETNQGVVGQGIYDETEPVVENAQSQTNDEVEEIQLAENEPAINLDSFEVGVSDGLQNEEEKTEESEQPSVEEIANEFDVDDLVNEIYEDLEEVQEPVAEESTNALDEYDVFKKKNIDVDKYMNEIPGEYNEHLPFINVDSDYVVNDYVGTNSYDFDNSSDGESFIDVNKNVATFDKEKLAEISGVEQVKEEQPVQEIENSDIKEDSSVEQEDVENQETAETEQISNSEDSKEIEEQSSEESQELNEVKDFSKDEEVVSEEQPDEVSEPVEEEQTENIEENPAENVNEQSSTEDVEFVDEEMQEPEKDDINEELEELSDEHRQNIAQAISGIRANMYQAEIDEEDAQPISRREKPFGYESPTERYEEFSDEPISKRGEVTHLNVNDSAESIISSVRSTSGGFDNDYQQSLYNAQNPANMGYYAPYNQYQNDNFDGSFAKMFEQNANPYNSQNVINDMFNESFGEFDAEKKPNKKTSAKKSTKKEKIDDDLENFNFEKEVMEAMSDEQKKRGRPKKQVIDETVTIKNDEEFNQILSRAEKLMRKSEEGLSASQSKRIEKELKVLMDAMNRYKENEEK